MVTLQPIYEKLFFIIYYQSLVVAGTVSYVIIREEFDLCSVAIILCTSISILECYWWCHLVDTFKELVIEFQYPQRYFNGANTSYLLSERNHCWKLTRPVLPATLLG